jgi:hypothetical protein
MNVDLDASSTDEDDSLPMLYMSGGDFPRASTPVLDSPPVIHISSDSDFDTVSIPSILNDLSCLSIGSYPGSPELEISQSTRGWHSIVDDLWPVSPPPPILDISQNSTYSVNSGYSSPPPDDTLSAASTSSSAEGTFVRPPPSPDVSGDIVVPGNVPPAAAVRGVVSGSSSDDSEFSSDSDASGEPSAAPARPRV